AAALFLTLPYVGYMDNITCLFLLAMTLPFLQPARTSWGARTALALLMFSATMTHPTTLAIFVVVLVASAGLHLLTSRFSLRETWRSDGWVLLSSAVGALAGGAGRGRCCGVSAGPVWWGSWRSSPRSDGSCHRACPSGRGRACRPGGSTTPRGRRSRRSTRTCRRCRTTSPSCSSSTTRTRG